MAEKEVRETKTLSLKERILKNSTISLTDTLDKSKFFNKKDMIRTSVPMLNVALSADINGGLTPGHTMIAGPSKHFKTTFALLLIHSFLKMYKDGIILFYDSEFGSPQKYFEGFNLPLGSIVHTPVTDIGELVHDLSVQLDGFTREDKVLIFIDSIGNLASRKEVKDALEGNTAADMTRAKALKSLFRIITPKIAVKDIPLITINHTYASMDMYSKQTVSGGTGGVYSADNIWVIGRQQDKDGTEISGYNFIINVEKSRYVREKSKIPISVSYNKGINRWSGFFELALEGKYITRVKPGWFAKVDADGVVDEKLHREAAIEDNTEFWNEILQTTNFAAWIKQKYSLPENNMMSESGEDTNAN